MRVSVCMVRGSHYYLIHEKTVVGEIKPAYVKIPPFRAGSVVIDFRKGWKLISYIPEIEGINFAPTLPKLTKNLELANWPGPNHVLKDRKDASYRKQSKNESSTNKINIIF